MKIYVVRITMDETDPILMVTLEESEAKKAMEDIPKFAVCMEIWENGKCIEVV